jgi:ribosome-associated toxin RatA of RatAB toxin-antitoxin module
MGNRQQLKQLIVPLAVGLACLAATNSLAQNVTDLQVLPDPSGQGGQVRASILIEAPPSVVWRVMLDCENAPRFVPNLRACSIEARAPNESTDVRVHSIAWLPGFPPIHVRFASFYQKNREIRFERLSGNIARMSGTWTLTPREDGTATFLSYSAYLSPSGAIPSGLVRAGLRRDTPKILQAVRAEALRQQALQ